ncbi:MAG TPA: DUF4097 family beta strand repeat-containing protein [Candidatus Acidoferrales bacterium]|nr:DUF4097 family beta strand repeat-containing protein [Candidatus Acidoferrales bacterium]
MRNGERRRSSIFTGLLLIVLGVIFLIDRLDPAFRLGHVIGTYWPVLIILWGIAKLVEHFAFPHTPGSRAPLLSGGEAAVLILLALVLSGFAFRDWVHSHYPDFDVELPPFHQSYTQEQQLPPQAIPEGAHVVVETQRGNLSIHAAADNLLRVHATESAWAPTKPSADEQLRNLHVVIEQEGNTYRLRPTPSSDGHIGVDLDVAVPATASVEADTRHGNIETSGIMGTVVARSGSGNIDLQDAGSDVAVHLEKGDAKIAQIAGNVELTGRGDNVDLSNVSGDVTVEGAFVGTVRASNVAKTIRWVSPWADLTIAQLSGHLEADSGGVEISGARGAAKLITHNKDINVTNVAGRIEIINTHGDVKVSYLTPPHDDLNVSNDSGDAEVTLPSSSSFRVSAISKSGEVKSDFDSPLLNTSNEDDRGQITGQIGTAGPMITIVTSYGTIELNKAG